MAALAVLLVVSEMITAMITQTIVIETRLETCRVLARPVSRISPPRAMPAPNRRIVPQSIREAWFQLRVNWRRPQSTGSTNSRPAARAATTPSSSQRSVRLSYSFESSPRKRPTSPGSVHRVMATPKAIGGLPMGSSSPPTVMP